MDSPVYFGKCLYFYVGPAGIGYRDPIASSSSLASGAYLCRHPPASFHDGRRTILGFYPDRPGEPPGYPDGFHCKSGSFSVDHQLHGRFPSAAAGQAAMGTVRKRRAARDSLHGVDYIPCRAAVRPSDQTRRKLAESFGIPFLLFVYIHSPDEAFNRPVSSNMLNKLPLLFILVFGARYASAQSADAQIRAARAASNDAIARHDATGIVRDMLLDYSIVTGRGQHMQGRDSLLVFWQKTFQAMPGVVFRRNPLSIIISQNDSLAWETGQWTAERSYSHGGNYSAMWRKSENAWRLAAELFVSLEK
jgi:ketosteroid isomerase-like protein